MADIEDLRIILRSEVDNAISGLKKASRQSKQSHKDWSDLNKTFKNQVKASLDLKNAYGQMVMQIASGIGVFTLASGALRGMTRLVNDSISAFTKQEQAVSNLNAVLSATGGTVGLTSKELQQMASDLQSVTTFGDEAIIGMNAVLLGFRSITGDQFKRTTEAILDMSQVMGGDLVSSANMLGKALDSPTQGMSALSRVGFVWTEQQREMVKAMEESGDLMGAQEVILGEVEKAFGGAARAAGSTATGALQQYKNVVGDTKEEIGRFIVNELEPMTRALSNIAAGWQEVLRAQNEAAEAFKAKLQGTSILDQEVLLLEKKLEQLERFQNSPTLAIPQELYNQQKRALESQIEDLQRVANEHKAVADAARERAAEENRAAEAAAEAERRRAAELQAYLDRVNNMYAQTSEGRIALLEKEIAEFEAYAKTAVNTAPQVAAVLQMLKDQLDNLRTPDNVSGNYFKDLEKIDQLYSKTPEGLIETKAKTIEFVKAQRELALMTGATNEELLKFDYILRDLQKSNDINLGGLEKDLITIESIVESLNNDLKDMLNNVLQGGLVDGFVAIGDALATGADSGQAFGQTIQQVGADALRQVSKLALTAGMRILAETGSAGLPIALALFGIAGITGIGSGALSSKRINDTYILDIDTDPIVKAERELRDERIRLLKEQLEIERKLRKEAIDKLKENFNLEYDVLKDLWERNIINTQEFKNRSGDLREERDTGIEDEDAKVAEAEAKVRMEEERQAQEVINTRNNLLYRITGAIQSLKESKYTSFSGSQFNWSQIETVISRLNSLIDPVQNANDMGALSAYKNKVDVLSKMSKDNRAHAFARGGDFITSGPQMIMVGDNPGGRERVRIDPLSSPNYNGSGTGGVVIQINAPVYGVDDLYEKLERAGKRLQHRGRRTGVLT